MALGWRRQGRRQKKASVSTAIDSNQVVASSTSNNKKASSFSLIPRRFRRKYRRQREEQDGLNEQPANSLESDTTGVSKEEQEMLASSSDTKKSKRTRKRRFAIFGFVRRLFQRNRSGTEVSATSEVVTSDHGSDAVEGHASLDDEMDQTNGKEYEEEDSSLYVDNSGGSQRQYVKELKNGLPVSVFATVGLRSYMEDEWLIANDLVAVFDGHGGDAVSCYLRKHLYSHLQSALSTTSITHADAALSSSSAVEPPLYLSSFYHNLDLDDDKNSYVTTAPTVQLRTAPPGGTVQDYENALRTAIHNVDKEILRMTDRKWSYQGSTAVIAWLHQQTRPKEPNTLDKNSNNKPTTLDEKNNKTKAVAPATKRTLLVANVGDSRAVMSRNGIAAPLSRDHKPNDPIEKARIVKDGGVVLWDGDTYMGKPIESSGVYRTNGVLSLSRAIGDRYLRPAVTSEPEIRTVPVDDDDDFIILATDGLWDVFSSQEAVDYVHEAMAKDEIESSMVAATVSADSSGSEEDAFRRQEQQQQQVEASRLIDTRVDGTAFRMVQEAIRRGSEDNITVIIVWLRNRKNARVFSKGAGNQQ